MFACVDLPGRDKCGLLTKKYVQTHDVNMTWRSMCFLPYSTNLLVFNGYSYRMSNVVLQQADISCIRSVCTLPL